MNYLLHIIVIVVVVAFVITADAYDDDKDDIRECVQLWNQKVSNYERRRSIRREAEAIEITNTKNLWDPWEPEWNCDTEERMGIPAWGDGPKFMCHPKVALTHSPCLIYSFGSNGKIQFESSIHKMNPECEIHVFDPTDTPDVSSVVSTVGSFHLWGLSDKEAPFSLGKVMSLTQIMEELGHSGRRLDVLKVDVEGAEWDSFNNHIWKRCAEGKLSISQLQIELHVKGVMTGKRTVPKRFFDGADKCGLMIFHKERNGWGCGGFRCLEYAFIHRDAALEAFIDSHCPSVGKQVMNEILHHTETLRHKLQDLRSRPHTI